MDPSSHRVPTSKLAKLTGGRCLSVRYRLAPQNPFPAALLDALMAYLSLLAPPPNAVHAPVPASKIVFSGDSAGGNVCTSLLQLLLQIRRSSTSTPPTIRFHGRDVEVPLPAGVAANSGWMDMTRCMPSIIANSRYDYLPPAFSDDFVTHFPKCYLWPTNPPRGDLYCDTTMLCHSLVSPLAAKDWRGTCPVLLQYGSEMLLDEGKVVARRMAKQGGKVRFQEYEAMPHCFAMIFEGLAGSKKCIDSWVHFMMEAANGELIDTSGTFIEAKTMIEKVVDVDSLIEELSDEDVDNRMRETRRKRGTGVEGETKILPRL